MSYIVKVSREGYNAITDMDPNHYLIRSDLNTFKILLETTVAFTKTGDGWDSVTMTYIPSAIWGTYRPFTFGFFKFNSSGLVVQGGSSDICSPYYRSMGVPEINGIDWGQGYKIFMNGYDQDPYANWTGIAKFILCEYGLPVS